MRIAVGIPTFNRAHVLLETIDNVLQQDPPANEIVIVDQSDWYPEGAREQLQILSQEGKIKYFRQEMPNLPMARNRILKETDCDIVIFIDDDVLLSPAFVKAHVQNYKTESVWAVCGGITERDTPVRPIERRTWRKVLDYKKFDVGWVAQVDDFGSLKGGNHSVRRSLVLDLGGYDELFTGVALREETDFAFRIIEKRGQIVFDSNAHLLHLRAPAGGCRVGTWGDWTAGCAVLRFALKHRAQLGRYFWCELWHAYRLGVLNKSSLNRPLGTLVRTIRFMLKACSARCF